MRNNQPVTQREIVLEPGQTIITKTDLEGNILFANEDFCEISGFSIPELVGKPQNIVRHPDMPPEAFRDLWATLNSGKPWNGIVKNRCKNGDYYWVDAFVAPIHDNQAVVGYLSTRVKPSKEKLEAAKVLYEDMNTGRIHWKLHNGEAVSPNLLHKLNPFTYMRKLGVAGQLTAMLVSFIAGILLCAVIAFQVLEEVKINGKIYARIVSGKDLIADVLPPPAYIIETWLTALEMLDADQKQLNSLIETFGRLEQDFWTRQQYWQEALPDSLLKNALITSSREPAHAFFELGKSRYIPLLKAGDNEQAHQLVPKLRRLFMLHRQAIDTVVNEANQQNQREEAFSKEYLKESYLHLLLVGLALIILVVTLGVLSIRRLKAQLGGEPECAAEIANHIAAGNLGLTVDYQGTSSLLAAMSNMQGKLQATLARVQDSAVSVTSIARQLSGASGQLQNAAEKQSHFAGGIAANGEEMNHNILGVVANIERASQLSQDSEITCANSTEVIHQAVSSIQEIADTVKDTSAKVIDLVAQSDKVAEVVKVIHSIADQTNLLALNASIEAARAGETGRGFAVVAEDVRNLAKRTADATIEISQVINTIQNGMNDASTAMQNGMQKVNQGMVYAQKVGNAIENIQESSNMVAQAIEEISAAMREQSTNCQGVVQNITQIAQAANNNRVTANETAQAALELEKAASNLAQAVARFAI